MDYLPHINHSVTTKILKLQQMQTCSTKAWTCTSLSTLFIFPSEVLHKPFKHFSWPRAHLPSSLQRYSGPSTSLKYVFGTFSQAHIHVLDKCLYKCQTEEFGICESWGLAKWMRTLREQKYENCYQPSICKTLILEKLNTGNFCGQQK